MGRRKLTRFGFLRGNHRTHQGEEGGGGFNIFPKQIPVQKALFATCQICTQCLKRKEKKNRAGGRVLGRRKYAHGSFSLTKVVSKFYIVHLNLISLYK